jgi:hypothetical protein
VSRVTAMLRAKPVRKNRRKPGVKREKRGSEA